MRAARALVVLAFLPRVVVAQGNPVGPEFRVNTYTTNAQRYPSVARSGSGDFLVVWSSSDQDGSSLGVFGQRHSGSGVPLGPEFRVNTYTTGQQAFPAVASDGAGSFVVVWQSPDGLAEGIFGQRYDSSGAPLGPEFRVNTNTANSQTRPSVAVDSAGNFVVVWQGGSLSNYDVFGQRYTSSGTPLGPEFRVNTYAGQPFSSGPKPSISSDSSGNFVVIWEGAYGSAISGQRYSNAGVPLGSEFIVVMSCLPCLNFSPSVASESAGDFVVVWASSYPYGPANNAIVGQRYASSGAALGGKFQASTYEAAYQSDPHVASDASGNFVVVWASEAEDGSLGGVFGRRFSGSGAGLGLEFRVNAYTSQAQKDAAVAALGNFVVAWSSNAQDGSAYGIFGQRFNMIVPVELMRFGVE